MENNSAVNFTKTREPLFHIVKRNSLPRWKALLFRVFALVAVVLVCSVVTYLLTKLNPVSVWQIMFEGSFKNEIKYWWMLREVALLLGVALAVTPAFKMKFWNCGAEGQVLIGALCTYAAINFTAGKFPLPVVFIIVIASALLGGAVWGVIPSIFFAFFKTNETLFTLMMNYVAKGLITLSIIVFGWGRNLGVHDKVNLIDGLFKLPQIYNGQLLMVLIVGILTVLMYIYLNYTKQGYEISVVGESENTANYIGINVKKVIVRTMLISGAVCGLIGFLIVSGRDYDVSVDTAGGRGFTAIMVSWLAKFNPLYMILTSFLIIFFQFGSKEVMKSFGITNDSFSDILVGIAILIIIGSEFFINYQIKFHKRKKEVK